MSIIYCERHDHSWDSDFLAECPACENEHHEETNMKTQHTPGPYKQLGKRATGLGSENGKVIGFVLSNDPEDLENLAFIIRACNCHYDLLEALKIAYKALIKNGDDQAPPKVMNRITNAIDKAEQGE